MHEYIPGLAGIPCAKSKISDIDGDKGVLEYRGIDIHELVETTDFIEMSYFLIYERWPSIKELKAFDGEIKKNRKLKFKVIDIMKQFPEKAHPMQVLQSTVSALGMFYPHDNILNPIMQYSVVTKLIAKIPTIAAAWNRIRYGDDPIHPRDDLSHASNFLYMLEGEEPEEEVAWIFDQSLILHAEHTMNASTFATLVVASTLADPYTVFSSALGSLSGPLHGGANEQVIKMLHEIGSPEKAHAYLDAKMEQKEKIPGFGHRVYKTYDPRAIELEKLLQQLIAIKGETKLYAVAKEVERICVERMQHKGIYPNVDFYSGVIYHILGIPTDMYTSLFAMSRISGWLAHWIEYIKDNKLFRPTQIYIGEHDQHFIPMHER